MPRFPNVALDTDVELCESFAPTLALALGQSGGYFGR
jgi:hypothetical protein